MELAESSKVPVDNVELAESSKVPVDNVELAEPSEKATTVKKSKKKSDEKKVKIFNYNPSQEFLTSYTRISPTFKIFSLTNAYKEPGKPNTKVKISSRPINYSDIKEKENNMVITFSGNKKINSEISRFWFLKYEKYKIKYLKLKKKLNQ